MRRCAVSISSNIAEGAARQGNKEFIQFLYIATGSATELDTQLEISKKVGLIDQIEYHQAQDKTTKVTMMLRGLIRSLKRQQS